MTMWYRPVKPGTKRFKLFIIKIVFVVLGRAFQSASRNDPDVKKEVSSWDDGFTLIMKVLPDGPLMGLEKKSDQLIFKWSKLKNADLEIYFRNIESAFMVMTPQIGAPQAFAEKRMSIKGDLGVSMSFTRALNSLLALLYPRIIVKRLVKRVPVLTRKKIGIRIWLYTLGILLGI
ncbi:MAG: hypothetical protein U9N77_13500 [Thermodesulfobacteriota bacterium]|nr:hypothetical protein [Thermodesulfobacteriota bacterium]